jgi:large subunit ribosomal protein L25
MGNEQRLVFSSTTKQNKMKVLELAGKLRTDAGKKATKKLRSEGLVPCVINSKDGNVNFSIPTVDLRPLLFTPHVYLLAINVEGTVYNAILKSVQNHVVTDEVLHIDFIKVTDDKKVEIEVPVTLEGFAEGVKAGGKLTLVQRKLKVRALKQYLPDIININVESLKLGASLKIRELSFDNIELLNPGNSVVAAIRLTRAAKGAMAAAATK